MDFRFFKGEENSNTTGKFALLIISNTSLFLVDFMFSLSNTKNASFKNKCSHFN